MVSYTAMIMVTAATASLHARAFLLRPSSVFAVSSKLALSAASPSKKMTTSSSEKQRSNANSNNSKQGPKTSDDVPLYRVQGIFAVNKPLDWTSNDVVSYIRGILERDTRARGGTTTRVGSRRKKNRIVKVGHGGTLDPRATGVLAIGVGQGTKQLQSYLTGSKRYYARAEFGFETDTLDMAGNITKRDPFFKEISRDEIQNVLPQFTGTIQQVPPIFSAIRKDGKRLYDQARAGKTAEDLNIEPREVQVYKLDLLDVTNTTFDLDMHCGGGTYVRALVRDIAYELNTLATTTILTRTQHGPFDQTSVLEKEDWNADAIYAQIARFRQPLAQGEKEKSGKQEN